MESPTIVLLTDFGSGGWYPGVMKGVILGIEPRARIVDLCHDVSPQDISEGAFILGCSLPCFPEGTVFVCVVDPGVGGERRSIIADTGRYMFTGPDNGILSPVLGEGSSARIYEVEGGRYTVKPEGETFLGRDLFAPVAAHLASGVPPEEIGRPARDPLILPAADPIVTPDGQIRGRTVHIDTYGNMMTDISEKLLLSAFGTGSFGALVVKAGDLSMKGIGRYYDQGKAGELMALINSWGYLEIAVSMGSAAGHPGLAGKGRPAVSVKLDTAKGEGI